MYSMKNQYILLTILLELSLFWSCAMCMNLIKIPTQKNTFLNHVRVKRGWQWKPLYVLEEQELKQPLYVGQLKSDSDVQDGSIKYILSGEGAGTIFAMDEHSGNISVLKKLDREEKAFYTLQAQAVYKVSGVPVETESEFVIKVLDVNDNEPKFINRPYIAVVPEMSPIGTSVIQVTAVDRDDPTQGNNAKVVYSIHPSQPQFSIEIKSGIIRVSSQIDRETKDTYHVVVLAQDMFGSSGALSSTATVIINVSDINDNAPKFQQKTYDMSIIESASVGEFIGAVLAYDIDVGKNAEMTYFIEEKGDFSMFNIMTDNITQEGIITLNKAVDFEGKSKRFHIQVRAENKYKPDFFDFATVRVSVEDVDEPPVFLRTEYYMEILENATVGSYVGTVHAKDPDSTKSAIRYGILYNRFSRSFEIYSGNGSIITSKPLDREEEPWHNITITATEARKLCATKELIEGLLPENDAHINKPENPGHDVEVQVYIHIIDVNDHPPELQNHHDIYVCEKTKSGQQMCVSWEQFSLPPIISSHTPSLYTMIYKTRKEAEPEPQAGTSSQVPCGQASEAQTRHVHTISAVDKDKDPVHGQEFSFTLESEEMNNSNFSLIDNADDTATILALRDGYSLQENGVYYLTIITSDNGIPALSSTSILTIQVCDCGSNNDKESCKPRSFPWKIFSSGVFIAISIFTIILIALALIVHITKKNPANFKEKEEDLKENIVKYDDEGGGEEDTEAFDITGLRHQTVMRENKRKRTIRTDIPSMYRLSLGLGPDVTIFREFLSEKLNEANEDPCGFPPDSLHTYAYEGSGSLSGSLSSLESLGTDLH